MKRLILVFLPLFFLFLSPGSCLAITDPQAVPNNRFGIHIVSEADLDNAAELVNGNNGEWGYVSLVIRQDERDTARWTSIFNKMNGLKLIPIVRIATEVEKQNWKAPDSQDGQIWADFLDSLPWPVKNRYVIIFNEPNHAKEWGGKINPEQYGQILKEYSQILKEKNEDFFVLPAGLDASASNIKNETMDELAFLSQVKSSVPDWTDYIDGWTSHSYPQPNFQGSASSIGRGTIRTFEWELANLKKMGLEKNLPVFITETGWRKNGYLENQLNNLYRSAFENAWNRPDIIAVTPFLLNYQSEPFTDFSWQKLGQEEFYPFYYVIREMAKIKGKPVQTHAFEFLNKFPGKLVAESHYNINLEIKNSGQSILNSDDFELVFNAGDALTIDEIKFKPIYPKEKGEISISFSTGAAPTQTNFSYWLSNENKVIGDKQEIDLQIFAFPDLHLSYRVGLKNQTNDRWFKLSIYELPNQQPIGQYNGSTSDQSQLIKIQDIIFGKKYLLTLKVFNCLPKNVVWQPTPGLNEVDSGEIWAVDFNNNDKFDLGDVWELAKKPKLIKQVY